MQCEHAFYATHGGSVQCRILNEQGKKWGFCIHQYYCRERGSYLPNNDAAKCKLREKEVK